EGGADRQDRTDVGGFEPAESGGATDGGGDGVSTVGRKQVVDDLDDLFGQHRRPSCGALADERLGWFAQREELSLSVGARTRASRGRLAWCRVVLVEHR